MKLQINENGAWRNVAEFPAVDREAVLVGLVGLAQALGRSHKWALLHNDGRRERLLNMHEHAFPGWDDVTPEVPKPLEDVMVSAYDSSDDICHVFQAWRSATDPNCWMISGSEEVLRTQVYAHGPVMAPAPRPAALPAKRSEA